MEGVPNLYPSRLSHQTLLARREPMILQVQGPGLGFRTRVYLWLTKAHKKKGHVTDSVDAPVLEDISSCFERPECAHYASVDM